MNNDGSNLRRITYSDGIDTEPFFFAGRKVIAVLLPIAAAAHRSTVQRSRAAMRAPHLRGEQ